MTKASESKDSNIEPYYVYTGSNAVQRYIYIYVFFLTQYTVLF